MSPHRSPDLESKTRPSGTLDVPFNNELGTRICIRLFEFLCVIRSFGYVLFVEHDILSCFPLLFA